MAVFHCVMRYIAYRRGVEIRVGLCIKKKSHIERFNKLGLNLGPPSDTFYQIGCLESAGNPLELEV